MKFWRFQDKEEYTRRKAGDILARNPLPEPLPERAPRPEVQREPMPGLGPQPAPVQPPTGLDVPFWPGLLGRGQEPMPAWMAKLREIASVSWEKWGRPTMGHWMKGMAAHPTARLWMPEEMREPVTLPGLLGAAGAQLGGATPWGTTQDILAGMWESARAGKPLLTGLAEEPERGRELEAQLPKAVRLVGRQVFDPFAIGGGVAGRALPGALGAAYKVADVADLLAFYGSATRGEMAASAALMGAAKAAPYVVEGIRRGVPELRRLLAGEVGAVELPGKALEGAKRPLAADVQELSLDQINIDPRKYQKRAIGKEGVGFREGRVKWILEHWDEALMTPVKVRRMPDGTFDLLGGHHRMEVLRRKGIGTVTAQIFDVDTAQAQHIARIDNMLVQGYEPSEWAAIVRGRADAGLSVAEVADEFGIKKPSTVAQYLSLSYLPDGLLQAVDVGLLPQRVAVALGEGAQKHNIGPSTLQQLWLREIKPSPREWMPTDVRTLFERIAPRAEALESQMQMFGELPGMEGQRDSFLAALREMKDRVKELNLRKTRLGGVEREIAKDRRAGKAVSPRLEQAAALLRQDIAAADSALRQIERGELDRVMARARPEAPAPSVEAARPPLEMRPEEVRPTARMERPTFLTPEEAQPVFGREGLPRRVPEAAPEAMRRMEVPPEEAARLAREAEEAAGQRRLGATPPEAPPVRAPAPEVAPEAVSARPARAEQFRSQLKASSAFEGGEVQPGEPYSWRSMGPAEYRRMVEGKAFGGPEAKRGAYWGWYPAYSERLKGKPGRPKFLVEVNVPSEMQVLAREATRNDVTGVWRSTGEEWEKVSLPAAPVGAVAPAEARALEAALPPTARPLPSAPEPAVPPVTVPSVPAPPAVGVAAGIPGPPPVGAVAVPAAAGAVAGPPVVPPTGLGVPPGPPVQPPLPGAGIPPQGPSPVTVPSTGPSRLPRVLSNPQITGRVYQPDALRQLMTWAERANVRPLRWALSKIGIVGTDPPSEALVLWSSIKGTGNTAAMAAVADLRQYGDAQKLFGAKDMLVDFQGRKLHLLDILEGRHPDFPMTPEQTAFRDAGWALSDDQLALVHGEGIRPPQISFPEGQHYWPRDIMLRRLPNGTIEVGVVQPSPGGKFLTALMKSEHPRQFKTAAEGEALGFEYADPIDSMEFLVQQSYRAIAGQRVLDFVSEFIPSRVGRKIRFGETVLPGVPGRYFRVTDLGGIRDMLYDTPLTWPDNFIAGVNAVNRVPRLFQTVFDVGPIMLQMFGTLTRWPKVWAESTWRAWRSGFDAPSFAKFLAQPDHAATVRRYAPEGLITTGHELTAGIQGIVGKLPVIGKLAQVGGRVFDNMLTAARVLGLEATEHMAKTPEDTAELVRFWNVFTGVVESGSQGITRKQQALESVLLYSPRLHRATYSILFDVAQGGLRGKMARRSLGQFAAATFLGYLGLCGLLHQKPRLDPKEGSRWLTIRVGDQYVGIGGPLFMTLRTLAQVVREPEEARDLAWRYVRGRLSPVVSTAIDVFHKRDAMGMPIRTVPQLTKRIIADNLTPIWVQGVVESGAKDWKDYIAVTSTELAGLRTFPVSPARKRNALREELAQASFRRPWAQLSRPQKYALEQSPDLKAATEEARALGRKREQPWALFWADVESQREPYKVEIAQITQQFRRNELTGNQYREAVQERQMIMARIPDMLRTTREYKGIDFARPAAQNPIDEFIDAYYQIAAQARDPLTGMADAREIVRQREQLKQRTDATVVREAMPFINKNLDPRYVEAREQYYEYMRIPQYIGLSDEQAQAANEAMRKYSAMRRANPMLSPDMTRARLAQQDPRAVVLMQMASSRRNPARRYFWATHPLLSVFYSDLTEEEVEMVAPGFMPQQAAGAQPAQLPSWAATASIPQPQAALPAWATAWLPGA